MSHNCRTNSEGECTLTNVSEGTHVLTATKNGYTTYTREINVDGSQLDLDVTLDKTPEPVHTKNITFQLKDENGDNITVYEDIDLEIVDYEQEGAALYTGTIDATGKVTINNIEYGHYKISIPEAIGQYAYDGLIEELIVNEDTPNKMNLRIPYKRAEIHCTVKKGDDTGCPGLTVAVYDENDAELIASATTGSAGGCNIRNLLYGVYRIKVYDASLDVENNPYFYMDTITVNSENIDKRIKLDGYYTCTFQCGTTEGYPWVLTVFDNDHRYAKNLPLEYDCVENFILPNGTYHVEITTNNPFLIGWSGDITINNGDITIGDIDLPL